MCIPLQERESAPGDSLSPQTRSREAHGRAHKQKIKAPTCIDVGVAVLATSRHRHCGCLPAVLLPYEFHTGPARAPPAAWVRPAANKRRTMPKPTCETPSRRRGSTRRSLKSGPGCAAACTPCSEPGRTTRRTDAPATCPCWHLRR